MLHEVPSDCLEIAYERVYQALNFALIALSHAPRFQGKTPLFISLDDGSNLNLVTRRTTHEQQAISKQFYPIKVNFRLIYTGYYHKRHRSNRAKLIKDIPPKHLHPTKLTT